MWARCLRTGRVVLTGPLVLRDPRLSNTGGGSLNGPGFFFCCNKQDAQNFPVYPANLEHFEDY